MLRARKAAHGRGSSQDKHVHNGALGMPITSEGGRVTRDRSSKSVETRSAGKALWFPLPREDKNRSTPGRRGRIEEVNPGVVTRVSTRSKLIVGRCY